MTTRKEERMISLSLILIKFELNVFVLFFRNKCVRMKVNKDRCYVYKAKCIVVLILTCRVTYSVQH